MWYSCPSSGWDRLAQEGTLLSPIPQGKYSSGLTAGFPQYTVQRRWHFVYLFLAITQNLKFRVTAQNSVAYSQAQFCIFRIGREAWNCAYKVSCDAFMWCERNMLIKWYFLEFNNAKLTLALQTWLRSLYCLWKQYLLQKTQKVSELLRSPEENLSTTKPPYNKLITTV